MFQIEIEYDRRIFNFLENQQVERTDKKFCFLHKTHFFTLISRFIFIEIMNQELELQNLNQNTISNEEFALSSNGENITKIIKDKIEDHINAYYFFSYKHFSLFFSQDIRAEFQKIFDEFSFHSSHITEISLGETKEEVLYLSVLPNGSIKLEKKDCTEVSIQPYNDQEYSIAEVLYFNPTILIVYDSQHLLKPELATLLRKMFKKKVNFLESRHPLH